MKSGRSSSLLLAYYGDDFTGSTDVMESLARAGLRTVLFLRPPTPEQLAKFPGLRAFGIAGGSRAMSPQQMNRALPPAFKALKASGARFVHYKTCSTFDSSPTVGSIGRAIELGRSIFGQSVTPLVVGVPVLGRYVAFGNLFARSGLDAEPARLDRHPTMSRHPVTPMDEADIRLHLAKQTKLPVELLDAVKLDAAVCAGEEGVRGGNRNTHFESLCVSDSAAQHSSPIVLLDTLREEHLPVIGRFIAHQLPRDGQVFCAGSSGIEYALVAYWRETGLLSPARKVPQPRASSSLQIVTISGSCSPVTDRQIGRAVEGGFVEIGCDIQKLANRESQHAAVTEALTRAREALDSGRSVIFQTARGPADHRRTAFAHIAGKCRGTTKAEKLAVAGECLSHGLAHILEEALRLTGARRAVVCGGDTSTHVARALGIEALEFVATVAPGAPLCRVRAPGRVSNGCEMVFKGGQVGRDSFFLDLVNGNTK